MKGIRLHKQVAKEIERLDPFTRRKLAELFTLLTTGESLGLPVSRPMPVIANGAHELRLKDRGGQYRVFYFTKHKDAVLIFHFLKKKTQGTPHHEIEIAQSRLEEML
ncbi:MAG: type II toxin-antitoxin system RelE/ParE family toxin [Bdellovibrionales bacterium]|nr:type II toxin-antitoxin system RelE/ParE family toxin [Bdellovibrionales bacterium]